MLQRFPDKPLQSAPAVLAALRPGEWLCQVKMDGWRCVMERTPSGWTYTSRHNKPLPVSAALRAEVEPQLIHLPTGTILDGEWMARRSGVLAERLWLFDVMRIGMAWQTATRCDTRFAALADSVPAALVVPSNRDDYAGLYEASKLDPTSEGIVLKALDSTLIASVRQCANNPRWLKVKWRDGGDGQTQVH